MNPTTWSVDVTELLDALPTARRKWEVLHRTRPDLVCAPADQPCLLTWVRFLFAWHRERREDKAAWLKSHLDECLMIVAIHVERYVVERVLDQRPEAVSARNALIDLRTRKKRRKGVDPLVYEALGGECSRICGSSNTIGEVLAGRGNHADQVLTCYTNQLYLKAIVDICGEQRYWCLNWDPGSNAGWSWKLTLYCVGNNTSGVLPAHVPTLDRPP